MSPSLLPIGGAVLIAVCAAACWFDGRERRLPNWLCLVTLVCGLAFAFAGGSAMVAGGHLLHAFIALLIGMALTAMGMFGAGDAKFYAAIASWFALGKGLMLLLSVSLAGLGLFVCWFIYRRLRGIPMTMKAKDDKDKLPYGFAIAGGALLAFFFA